MATLSQSPRSSDFQPHRLNGPLAVDIDETIAALEAHISRLTLTRFPLPGQTNVDQLITRHKFADWVPAWKANPAALAFITECRQSEDLHRKISPKPGARDGLLKLSRRVRLGLYLTGRPDNLHQATFDWLKHHRFPDLLLVCRPSTLPLDQRHGWKGRELATNSATIGGIIEDDHRIVEQLPPDYPGIIILVGNHANVARHQPRVVTFPDWANVEQVSSAFASPDLREAKPPRRSTSTSSLNT